MSCHVSTISRCCLATNGNLEIGLYYERVLGQGQVSLKVAEYRHVRYSLGAKKMTETHLQLREDEWQ